MSNIVLRILALVLMLVVTVFPSFDILFGGTLATNTVKTNSAAKGSKGGKAGSYCIADDPFGGSVGLEATAFGAVLFFIGCFRGFDGPDVTPNTSFSGDEPQEILVGTMPADVALMDLTQDGLSDLAVANQGSHDVSIVLRNVDGSFGEATQASVGFGPAVIRSGDFNADGAPDLVTANQGAFPEVGGVSLLIGNGDGSFQPAVELSSGNTNTVAVADVNADGRDDIILAPFEPSVLNLRLGNGDGTFQDARSFDLTSAATSLAVADFNGDQHLDIAAGIQSGLTVLSGDGTGSFQSSQAIGFPSNGSTFQTETGDFDGDGDFDIVTTNADNSVAVLLNIGDGAFQAPVFYVVNDLPNALSVLDVNEDNNLDLFVSNFNAEHTSILLGRDDGTFEASRGYATGDRSSDAVSLTPSDFNQDEFVDLAVSTGRNTLLFPGAEGERFGEPLALEKRSEFVTSGDFNQDTFTDLALVRRRDETGRPGILILEGNGDGTFVDGQTIRFPGFDFLAGPIVAALVDGNDFMDLLVLDRVADEMKFLADNGDGTFQEPVGIPVGLNPVDIAQGDLNGDGRLDAVLSMEGDLGLANGGVSVLLGVGDGSFQASVEVLSEVQAGAIALGDLNNDLNLDLVVNLVGMFFEFDVAVLLGTGDGGFQAPVNLPRPDEFAFNGVRVAIVDFDADGNAEVLVTDANQSLSIYPGNGDGTFGEPVQGDIGPDARDMAVVDLTQDGKPDVALASSSLVVTILNRSTLEDEGEAPAPTGP